MREVHAGIWHWEARHPALKPDEDWDETVSSVLVTHGGPTDRAALERALS